ncbi:MAG: hypothetical protein K2L87_02965, partial [Clostridiales bacterium]|nr:hypothetical protein [Clostridiales bacterium]
AGTYNDVVAKIKVKNYSTSGEVRNELRFTLSGGKVLALEVYRNGGGVWQIQLPPWDGCDANVSNWGSRYNLNAEEVELLNGDGLWFEVARVGADYYVFLNGTQTNVFTLEGTADETAIVSIYHWGDGGTDIEYEYGIDGAAEDAFEGRVILPETLEHGTITADKQTFDIRNNEQITFTITADENYLLGDVRINGVSVITEVVNGTLTVNANAKELNVEVVFVDATIPVNTTIVFTDGDEIEGVAVRIVSNGQVVAEDVISGGKVTFEQVSRGTYRVEAKLLNYWANAGTVLAAGGEDAEIKLASLFRDELLTVDGNVSHNVNREYFHELNSNITGDAWFATKFRVDGSTIVGDDGQIRFGIDLNFGTSGSANRTLTFVYN